MDQEIFDSIVDSFENAGGTVRSYSGRGMFGKSCLGIVCENPIGIAIDAVIDLANAHENAVDMLEHLRGAETDSMGRDAILYFPEIPWMGDK